MMLEKKNSLGVRSGDRGGHFVVPLRLIHPPILAARQWDEVVHHRAECKTKTSVVLRVGLHPRTAATSHSTIGSAVRRTLPLLATVLAPRECSHVERTIRLFWG